MVDPALTYVAGIAFLVLLIAPMLYLMYNYEGVDGEETPNENLVRGAGPIAAEGPETDGDEVEGDAEDTRDAVEAGEPEDADESSEDAEDADDTEEANADEA